MTVDSQHSICSDTLKKYQTAYSCLQSMDEIIDTKGSDMTTLKEALVMGGVAPALISSGVTLPSASLVPITLGMAASTETPR